MEKAKLKYIEEQCNQMLTGLYRLRHIDEGNGRLQLSRIIMVRSGIEIIAAVLKRPVKITCDKNVYLKEVTCAGIRFSQMGFYPRIK
jgi:hypothetical protein